MGASYHGETCPFLATAFACSTDALQALLASLLGRVRRAVLLRQERTSIGVERPGLGADLHNFKSHVCTECG